jgi:hypothetical protein
MAAGVVLISLCVCGVIVGAIGSAKNRSVFGSFLLGGVLGLIGIVIVGVLPKAAPKPPPGMRAVQCLRCNALQNVPDSQTTFECWQCKLVSNVDESVPRPSHMRNQKSE